MTRWCVALVVAVAATLGALARPHALEAQAAQTTGATTTLRYGSATEAGLAPEAVDAALQIYRDAVAAGDLVGAVVLIARDGVVVAHEALGWSDMDDEVPMATNTLFQMASNTKPVVAAAIARMVEEGQLGFQARVSDYLPEWDNDRARYVTLHELLSHTSGLRIPTLFMPNPEPGTDLLREAARFGAVGPAEEPGEYSYSNPGFNTLGALLELQSGELLEDHLDQVLYTPLGMEDSYNYRADHPLDGKRDRLGPMYYQRDDDGAWVEGQAVTIPFARGSGGMISTAWDYAIFLQTFLNGGSYGEVTILDPVTVEVMTTDHVAGEEGYGYGWSVSEGVFGHGGSDGTDAFVAPEAGVIGLVFTQTPRGRPPFGDFVRAVLEGVGR